MRRQRRRLILACLAFALVGCLSTRGPTQPSGAPAPTFEALSHRMDRITSEELVAEGPVVLVFYRGFW